MKTFRSHILRTYSFVVLLIGIALHLVGDSEQQGHHEAFTSWLESHLKNSESEAHQKLENLSRDLSGMDEVIRKASEVVVSHADDFSLPLESSPEKGPDADGMYQVLLEQWNHFQNSDAGMGKAIFVESAKSITILPNDGKFSSISGLSEITPSAALFLAVNTTEAQELYSSYLLHPLASGTAIGAP